MVAYAFPFVQAGECATGATNQSHSVGMTLKDWFAGQIVAAMIGSDPANSSHRDQNGQPCAMDKTKLANIAKNAYQAADALVQARAAFNTDA